MPLPSGRNSALGIPQSLASRTRGTTDAVYEDKITDPGARNPTPLLTRVSNLSLSYSEPIEWELSYYIQGCCKDWRVISVKHQSLAATPFS